MARGSPMTSAPANDDTAAKTEYTVAQSSCGRIDHAKPSPMRRSGSSSPVRETPPAEMAIRLRRGECDALRHGEYTSNTVPKIGNVRIVSWCIWYARYVRSAIVMSETSEVALRSWIMRLPQGRTKIVMACGATTKRRTAQGDRPSAPGGEDLSLRNRLQCAAHHLRAIRAIVEGDAEYRDGHRLQAYAQRRQDEVKPEELNDERRATKELDVRDAGNAYRSVWAGPPNAERNGKNQCQD